MILPELTLNFENTATGFLKYTQKTRQLYYLIKSLTNGY